MKIFLNQLTTEEKQQLKRWFILLLFLSGIVIFILPFIFTLTTPFKAFDYSNTGNIGSTINGISSPFLAVLGIIVTFLAFYIQVKANDVQRKINEKQREDIKLERFENKFYELLRLHKENVNEISIDGYDGKKIVRRKAFVSMYKELRYTFFVTKQEYDKLRKSKTLQTEYKDVQLLKLAYIFFYTGVGVHSDKISKAMIGQEFDNTLYSTVRDELNNIERQHKSNSNNMMWRELEIEGIGKSKLPYSYRPFQGHMSRFGHYYRHLFQTVKFVVKQDKELINDENKLEYLRTLRAQLSDHEQVMLYYNAVVDFGGAWITNKYFTDYKMIHNIPLPLADFGITPVVKFEKELKAGMGLFEWLE